MKKAEYLGLLTLGTGLLLAACSGQSNQSGQKQEPVKYTIEMSEFAYSPNEIQVKVGQDVTIELVNTGALPHELMVGRNVKMHDNQPDGFEQDMFETAQVEPEVMGGMQDGMDMSSEGMGDEHTGFMVTVPNGGENITINFTATQDQAGEWEMGCFQQEGVHYDAGMKGKLVVVP